MCLLVHGFIFLCMQEIEPTGPGSLYSYIRKKLLDLRQTIRKITAAVSVLTLGILAAGLHMHFF